MLDIFGKPRDTVPVVTKLNKAASALDAAMVGKETRDPSMLESLRISSLPLVHECTTEEVEAFSEDEVLAEAFAKGFRLKSKQVESLMAYDMYGGAFLSLRVGAGKSLIALMLAQRAYAKGLKKIAIMLPSQVYDQMVSRDVPWARRHVPLSVPMMKLGQITLKRRQALARSGNFGVYFIPYSLLSVDDTDELLDWICPELIVLDEGHNLKNFDAARTGRMFGREGFLNRFEKQHGTRPEMVVMSGTITSKSLLDYWHLLKECLKERCPLPLNGHLVRLWAGVLDSAASRDAGGYGHGEDAGEGTVRTDTLMPIVRWAQRHFPDEDFPETTRGFRHAFRRRFETAPGIVASNKDDLGVSLVFRNEETPSPSDETWTKLQELTRAVVDDGVAPNGDIIDHAMNAYGWLVQLAAGFYNDLYWPDAEKFAKERDIPVFDAEEILDRAKNYHELQQIYHSAMRRWLTRNARPSMDTPFLVAGNMHTNGAGNVGPDLYEAWTEMHGADFEGRPQRRSRPIRVCDYKIRHAISWAKKLKKGRGAVLWHLHREVGTWLYEMGVAEGVEIVHCPSGQAGSALITSIGDYELGGKGDKIVTASVSGHGIGKNLPAFEEQFVVQWPRSSAQSEQMLGRIHRPGQLADSLTIHMCNTAEVEHTSFAAAMNDACYIQDTTGNEQKLMMGSFETPPQILSSSELRRRGITQVENLSGQQIQLLREKFGIN